MSRTITAVFDGKAFVPVEPVDLPTGTPVQLLVGEPVVAGKPPRPMTPDERRRWEAFVTGLRSAAPDPPTLDEAMRDIRGRP